MFYYSPLFLVWIFQLDRVTYAVVIIKGNYVWIKLTDTIFVLRISFFRECLEKCLSY